MSATTQFSRGDLTFDVTEDGPVDGEPVLLLHGFPQHSDSWDAVVPALVDAGYRIIRPNQRGYSPGARPLGRRAYKISELVADAAALIDHYGGSAHVVGHDWGAAVAWGLAAENPDRVRSLTALSVPHPGAFLRSMLKSRQALMSWYMLFFQLPWLPERLLRTRLAPMLVRTGQPAEVARRDAAGLAAPGAMTAALNWYRGMLLLDPRRAGDPVRRPTLFVWSDGDTALGRRGAEDTAKYVQGPYQFEVLHGVSHWIPEEAPDQLTALLLPHLKRWQAE
ncbi:MAG TPA: alpha/beta fold hydrolase [Pseudonocardia sp.]|jgi:pimeloyl-ACP methyl ester carboxylesterase|nr:alpha/beta fold hydrolase [Pseudonocardia sp.]